MINRSPVGTDAERGSTKRLEAERAGKIRKGQKLRFTYVMEY